MTIKTRAAAACMALATASTAIAAPVNVYFEFGDVSGTFYGLDDSVYTSSATSFDLTAFGETWTGVSTVGAISNAFILSQIPKQYGLDFLLQGSFLSDSGNAVLDRFGAGEDPFVAPGQFLGSVSVNSSDTYNDFLIAYVQPAVAPVPLPAGGLLLLSGLGGVAALNRRKKRAAALPAA